MAMDQTAHFTIGAGAHASDGACGILVRVVVEPVSYRVTHLVVEPEGRVGLGRLVPVDLVDLDSATPESLTLACTMEQFEGFEPAEETRVFLSGDAGLGYEPGPAASLPHFALSTPVDPGLLGNTVTPIVYDRVPLGEVEMRRGDQVHATDGGIGRVEGLVVDPSDTAVTHVILEDGHLWNRKNLAIPITAVGAVDAEGIWLNLTRDQVRDLPPVNLEADGAVVPESQAAPVIPQPQPAPGSGAAPGLPG
jgi:hypothetical protein